MTTTYNTHITRDGLILQRAIERIDMNDNGSGDEWDRAIRASVTQLEESLR